MLGAISKSEAYEPPASAPPPTGRHQVVKGVTGAQRLVNGKAAQANAVSLVSTSARKV